MKRIISPLATQPSQRVSSPLVRSPGVNMVMSSLGILASATVSKRGRSPSVMSRSPHLEEKVDSHTRSPSPVVSLSTPRKRNYTIKFPSPTRSPNVSRPPSPASSPLDGSRPTCSRRKLCKLISNVWKDFKPIYRDRKLVEAQCKHCDEIVAARKHVGTSSVRRHLASCKSRSDLHQIIEKLKSSAPSPHASMLKQWDFDQQTSRKLLARMIVLHEMPFSVVEYHGFREFVKSLNPLFKMASRVTIKNDCMELYKDQRSALCEFFQRFDGRVSLTADMWTSNQTLGYLCITCHFIDNKWNLQKKIIRFCMLETPHDKVTMLNVVLKSIQELNIEDKLFSMTLDNAAVNGSMVNSLRENLISKFMLHCNGDLLHVRCASHVFNLIVQDGLRAMEQEIDNIRNSVKYIKSSQSRMDKFKEIIAQLGICCGKMPKLDVPTRWNSTFLMLEFVLPYQRVFHTLGQEDKKYKCCPLPGEWRRAEAICNLLKVFHIATQTVSGSSYPTSNLYFQAVWNVRLVLEKEAQNPDPTIKSMIEEMQTKFNKYWLESYLTNFVPVIFDPRFKYGYIEFRLKQAFGNCEAAGPLLLVNQAIRELFHGYSNKISESLNGSTQGGKDEDMIVEEDNPLADWDKHLSVQQRQDNNELDRYLEEETFPRKDDFNILQWWNLHSSKYPVLSQIARDVLVVLAFTVFSKSAFSTGERVISDHRSRLFSETVEALICLQDWLRAAGRASLDGVGEEDDYYY